jgi:hypothetical protein
MARAAHLLRWVALAALSLAGCGQPGAAGDWEARALVTDTGSSIATGILEIDRDGEALLRVTAPGEPTLRARGRVELEGETAWVDLVGDLGAGSVLVEGVCSASERQMTCALVVDGSDWLLDLERERDGLLGVD